MIALLDILMVFIDVLFEREIDLLHVLFICDWQKIQVTNKNDLKHLYNNALK